MNLNLSLKLHISDVADAWRAARLQPFFKLSHECHVKDMDPASSRENASC